MYNTVQAQLQGGGTFADSFSPQVWTCALWKFTAAQRYNGTFQNITTRHPVMIVNTPFDPITPLSGAYEGAHAFPGWRVVVHKEHEVGNVWLHQLIED